MIPQFLYGLEAGVRQEGQGVLTPQAVNSNGGPGARVS